ncbi:MAG: DNA polymerase Y family protein [Alphaproteobacteria bacterium]|nr:DNA polymerase Y family protein [Alphaproteobacteria bacterium]
MKRYVSVCLPHWPTDRWRRQRSDVSQAPLVLTTPAQGGLRLTAVCARAAAEGLFPGQRLADARALVPELQAADADLFSDGQALARLADWCGRYTPWSAIDGEDGLCLDITGCAHLFGGEAALIADLVKRLASFGIAARAAVADTPAAAWAWARFGDSTMLEPGTARGRLAALPVEALRVSALTVESLRRLGLRRVGDLAGLPRGPLAARLGVALLSRLDRAFGVEAEAISPRRALASWRARLVFADGIARREDIDLATRELLKELCRALEQDGRGARRLELAFYRLDGTAQILEIGTSRPTRDAAHLARLFAEPLGTVEPGFGVETMILGAVVTDPLAARQMALPSSQQRDVEDLAPVLDRLQGRLGRNAVVRLVPVASHMPERAVTVAPALNEMPPLRWPAEMPRPVQLLASPEPIDVTEDEEGPQHFRWRRIEHRVAECEGPERIAPEWWRTGSGQVSRDYFWLQDEEGRRYWVYRAISSSRGAGWYLHGLFA